MNKTILLLVIIVLGAQAETQWRNHATFFGAETFEDLQGWSQESFSGTGISECADQSLAGGYGVAAKGAILKKSIEGIPTHYKLRITTEVHFMDSWDNEKFIIKVNDENMSETESNWRDHTSNKCGNSSWKERSQDIEIEFSHISGNIDIEFSSTLDQGAADESWAVRNIRIDYKYCDDCELVASEFEGAFSEEDIVGWNSNKEIDDQWVSSCEGARFIGGYGKFSQKTQIAKTYNNLPPHTSVVVSFLLWQIDSWDAVDSWRAVVDNKEGFNGMKIPGAHEGNRNCGGTAGYKDELVVVSFEIPHFAEDLEILFEDNLNQGANDESWGVSRLRIEAVTCKDNCQEAFTDNNWKLEDGSDFTKEMECQDVTIIGGYQNFGPGKVMKTYDNLPEHTHIQYSIELYIIDSWDKENLFFYVDDVSVMSTTNGMDQTWPLNDISCGSGSWKDEVQLITFEVPHTGPSATIMMNSMLNQGTSDESLGWTEDHLYAITHEGITEWDSDLTDDVFTEHSFTKPALNDGSWITTCGGKSILGGVGKFGKNAISTKEYSGLPEHSGIIVSFKTYFVDSWDNERLYLKVEGQETQQIVQKISPHAAPTLELCGKGMGDGTNNVWDEDLSVSEFYYPHTADTLDLEWYSTLDEAATNESWGLRDYKLYLVDYKRDFSQEDCPILFSECNFEGTEQKLCDKDHDLQDGETPLLTVKSIFVPEGWRVTLYEEIHYEGKDVVFESSQECLEDGPTFKFMLQNSKNTMKVHHKAANGSKHHHLRKQH